MDLKAIKGLLPHGSYKKIADTVGVAEGTVSQFFSKAGSRIGEAKQQMIFEKAMEIIQDQSWKGLELNYGPQKTNEIRAAVAA